MRILSEDQILYLATLYFVSHEYRKMIEPEDYPEPVKPINEIAHQIRTNNNDAEALYQTITDWNNGLADPLLIMIENLIDMLGQK